VYKKGKSTVSEAHAPTFQDPQTQAPPFAMLDHDQPREAAQSPVRTPPLNFPWAVKSHKSQ